MLADARVIELHVPADGLSQLNTPAEAAKLRRPPEPACPGKRSGPQEHDAKNRTTPAIAPSIALILRESLVAPPLVGQLARVTDRFG